MLADDTTVTTSDISIVKTIQNVNRDMVNLCEFKHWENWTNVHSFKWHVKGATYLKFEKKNCFWKIQIRAQIRENNPLAILPRGNIYSKWGRNLWLWTMFIIFTRLKFYFHFLKTVFRIYMHVVWQLLLLGFSKLYP